MRAIRIPYRVRTERHLQPPASLIEVTRLSSTDIAIVWTSSQLTKHGRGIPSAALSSQEARAGFAPYHESGRTRIA